MRRWVFCVADEKGWTADPGASAFLAPQTTRLSGLPRSLWGLTPTRDHNAVQLETLRAASPFAHCEAWLCLYLGDPWIRPDAFKSLCREKRVVGVAGVPSPLQYGRDFVDKLNSADLGPATETRAATRFRDAGLKVALVATQADLQIDSRAATSDMLIAAPSFDYWHNGGMAGWANAAQRIVTAASKDVVVMSGSEVSEERAKSWGAAGYVDA